MFSRDAGALPPSVTAAARPAPAFRDVYAEHLRFVWRVVRRLGVPASDAEDVCQEVFVVVHRKLAEFAHRSTVRTWLYGIAYRCASEYRRRAHVRRELPTEQPDAGAVEPAQLETIDRHRARELLDDILSELDHDKRAVFVFYEIEHVDMADIAEILDCPVQTAYSRLHAARRHVQAAAQRLRAKESNR
jgi:RNA polymerase sigma-70 factor (ECF subfamily)